MKLFCNCPVCEHMAPMRPLIGMTVVHCNVCGKTTVIYDKGTAEDQYNKILYEREGGE